MGASAVRPSHMAPGATSSSRVKPGQRLARTAAYAPWRYAAPRSPSRASRSRRSATCSAHRQNAPSRTLRRRWA